MKTALLLCALTLPCLAEKPAAFRRLDSGTSSGIAVKKTAVVRDQNSWNELWKQHRTGPPPKVDFRKEMVLGAWAGTMSTGGYTLAIDKVERTGKRLTVHLKSQAPAADAMTIQMLTQPYDIVAVPTTSAQVVWKTR